VNVDERRSQMNERIIIKLDGWFQDLIVERDNSRSYVFTHLKPNTTYTVSVAARNSVDIGPVVVKDITTTPIEKCNLKQK
jgi:hypothetical protein